MRTSRSAAGDRRKRRAGRDRHETSRFTGITADSAIAARAAITGGSANTTLAGCPSIPVNRTAAAVPAVATVTAVTAVTPHRAHAAVERSVATVTAVAAISARATVASSALHANAG